MERRTFLAGTGAVLLATPLAAEAQPAGKAYRIGWLAGKLLADSEIQALAEAFVQGLRSRGWIEGENITIVRRSAEGPESCLSLLIPSALDSLPVSRDREATLPA